MGDNEDGEPDWEPGVIPRRGTRWTRGADGSWQSLAPGSVEPNEQSQTSARQPPSRAQRRGVAVANIAVALATVLLAVAWWGTLGTDATFVYISAHPVVDFLVLSTITIGWLAFVWKWLHRSQ